MDSEREVVVQFPAGVCPFCGGMMRGVRENYGIDAYEYTYRCDDCGAGERGSYVQDWIDGGEDGELMDDWVIVESEIPELRGDNREEAEAALAELIAEEEGDA